jgi:hypothetical protein
VLACATALFFPAEHRWRRRRPWLPVHPCYLSVCNVQEALKTGMESLSQAEVGSALQVYFNLGELKQVRGLSVCTSSLRPDENRHTFGEQRYNDPVLVRIHVGANSVLTARQSVCSRRTEFGAGHRIPVAFRGNHCLVRSRSSV